MAKKHALKNGNGTADDLRAELEALKAENAQLRAELRAFHKDAALHPKTDTPFAQPGDDDL